MLVIQTNIRLVEKLKHLRQIEIKHEKNNEHDGSG